MGFFTLYFSLLRMSFFPHCVRAWDMKEIGKERKFAFVIQCVLFGEHT